MNDPTLMKNGLVVMICIGSLFAPAAALALPVTSNALPQANVAKDLVIHGSSRVASH